MTNPFAGAPALAQERWLIYFRAHPDTGRYPDDPFTVDYPFKQGAEPTWQTLVAAGPAGNVTEYSLRCYDDLWDAMDQINRIVPLTVNEVFTVHGASMLGRLFRWHARLRARELRFIFQPPRLRDVVEMVNAGAVLSLQGRRDFNIDAFQRMFAGALSPKSGYDMETGLLLALLETYGN